MVVYFHQMNCHRQQLLLPQELSAAKYSKKIIDKKTSTIKPLNLAALKVGEFVCKFILVPLILANPNYTIPTHTCTFNGPLSGNTRVSQYQKGKTNLDFTEARDSEWQWHQLGHMQVPTSLQTDNHTSTPPLSFYRPDALPAAQPTASKH